MALFLFSVLIPSQATQAGTRGQAATGVIHGVVRDEQGASVPQARIDVVCGSARRHVVASGTGKFLLTGLPAARCSVTAAASQFETARALVGVSAGTTATPALVLRVAGIATHVIVTATRGVEESTFRVPESTSVVSRADMDARPHVLTPEVLREEPGILLQQTTSAQASPIIRGFTSQSNVYLIDGVRFNTSTWRGGPSQYLAWVNGDVVDRMEIVRGPGSVQFGSDALGGTINVRTAQPEFAVAGTHVGGTFEGVTTSVDRSSGGTADIAIQGSAAAFHVGGGMTHVQDMRAGGGLDSHASVTRFLGLPSSVIGARLPGTGFDQAGGYLTGRIRAGANATINVTFMHDEQTSATRYDRTYGGDGLYKSGFSPQTLDFGVMRYARQGLAGFDEVSGAFSVNRQADGRFEQTRPTAILDAQQGTTTAYGYQLEGRRRLGARHQLSVGTEYYGEGINAARTQTNPLNGAVTAQRPDVPTGTDYTSLGVFAQDVTDLIPGRVSVRGGLRYGHFGFSTVADSSFGVPAEQVTTQALTFSVGTVVSLTKNLNATFTMGRGFRAPNAADLGAIGLSGGGGFEITPDRATALGGLVGTTGGTDAVSSGQAVPALGPEVLYSYEGGLKFSTARVGASVAAYDLEYLNSVQRRAIVFPSNVVGQTISGYTIVRQDASGLAYIAQDARPIGTRANADHARITGLDAEGHVKIGRQWSATAFFSMTNGHLLSTGEYLRRMAPPLGGARLRWSAPGRHAWLEGVLSFARAQTRFNSGDITDARIGANRTRASIASYFNGTAVDLGLVQGGLLVATGETLAQVQTRLLGSASGAPLFATAPGFVAVGARAGWDPSPRFGLAVIGENLTDRNYRLYGSGVDAPGRNIQVRVHVRF
jgi:outer membrane receptor protein involved in Fe transport